ncbi:MAG: ribonuclease P protein component [Opitutaceae bacterium]|nr:ribonuclease P protein component [Opitutaceae bacterium]
MHFRFTARQHLCRAREFEKVRRSGRAFQSAPFVFTIFLPELVEGADSLRRFGVIASRRVGNAVVRNRCKRISREVFRKQQHSLPEHCDCVLLVRRQFPDFTFAELEKKFTQACESMTRNRS